MSDGGALHHRSQELLLAHEDKSYPGAIIASMSIPWGEAKGDEDLGGYHLVWTREMVNSATGLLAGGDTVTPLRALTYLACYQQPARLELDSMDISQSVLTNFFVRVATLQYDLKESGDLIRLLITMTRNKVAEKLRSGPLVDSRPPAV